MKIYGIRAGEGTACRETTVITAATFGFSNSAAAPAASRHPNRDEIIAALIYEGLPGTYDESPETVSRLRRRVEDRLRKGTAEEIWALARILGVKLGE